MNDVALNDVVARLDENSVAPDQLEVTDLKVLDRGAVRVLAEHEPLRSAPCSGAVEQSGRVRPVGAVDRHLCRDLGQRATQRDLEVRREVEIDRAVAAIAVRSVDRLAQGAVSRVARLVEVICRVDGVRARGGGRHGDVHVEAAREAAALGGDDQSVVPRVCRARRREGSVRRERWRAAGWIRDEAAGGNEGTRREGNGGRIGVGIVCQRRRDVDRIALRHRVRRGVALDPVRNGVDRVTVDRYDQRPERDRSAGHAHRQWVAAVEEQGRDRWEGRG